MIPAFVWSALSMKCPDSFTGTEMSLYHVCSAKAAAGLPVQANVQSFCTVLARGMWWATSRELFLQAKQNMSKRKASDAASSPLDAAAASATAAAAAEETSPSKRMKAASDPADAPQVPPSCPPLSCLKTRLGTTPMLGWSFTICLVCVVVCHI